MKVRSIILAGGEGTRLGVLTARRAKPAVPFAGKYRIIDFPLSNCVNSNLFDIFIIAQYRPQSLIEHIGAGGPWDLNRDFTGGVRVYTPYKARGSDWFIGTADAVQQNFSFIKRGDPDLVLILSGDHIYSMDYRPMIETHLRTKADLTIATIQVPIEQASRYGIVGVTADKRITSFIEKPLNPPSNLVNMGVYIFDRRILDSALWEDHQKTESAHDFGKNILPNLVENGAYVYAFPYEGYWVDVGTVDSYWQAHMDLLETPPALDLYDRNWIIHTRSEERPPVLIDRGAEIEDSLICDGCIVENGARVVRSVLSPGVYVQSGAVVEESILFTDSIVEQNATLQRSILDKKVIIGERATVGGMMQRDQQFAMAGRN
ncbi:MAG TPA: glucose-1-phosphate adenylyltransferase, partial [Anaerolineaceae bacterium]|nr:glucose-1-phosphate adenylyltransferase [Anaerolineaceae bacterium]